MYLIDLFRRKMFLHRRTVPFNRAIAKKVMTAENRCSYGSTNRIEGSSHGDKVLFFLQENGAMDLNHGPIHIKAARHVASFVPGDEANAKVVHFQRHGQGYHNLIYGILSDAKAPVPDVYHNDVEVNPFLRSEIIDSPLTELGREQCRVQKDQASKLSPEVIIVSPLCRAVQTALITFDRFRGRIPFIAHDGCREELGLLTCNKRKALSETMRDYPDVDFSMVAESAQEEDNLWIPDRRECPKEQSKRIYSFLVDFIQNRPEKELAVVGHSAWLFTMCHAVLDFSEEGDEIKDWFTTGEIRSLRLEFSEKV
jgi:broad specificity phosphatase PhoE